MSALATEYFVAQAGQPYRIGLPVALCAEVLTLAPEQICPLPPVHPAILGVVSWRGQLLWTLALDQWICGDGQPQLALNPGDRSRTALVLDQGRGGRRLACVVWRLEALLALANQPDPQQPPDPLPSDPAIVPPTLGPRFRQAVPQHNLLLLNTDYLFQPDRW
ncbi:chemotaxis protein CheW [Prochlorothrix hollandica]|uniref:chemotaxis protein CheW n=1 Tax=Prochlorothrix hollandica TaxID=1223 RepID=UPI00034ABF90|nr:chemotaxis protein CheW [Prochlorothrix hollandica]